MKGKRIMKKIIYNIAIVLAASCLFASCEDDNYDEPNSGIKGRFIDAIYLDAGAD